MAAMDHSKALKLKCFLSYSVSLKWDVEVTVIVKPGILMPQQYVTEGGLGKGTFNKLHTCNSMGLVGDAPTCVER